MNNTQPIAADGCRRCCSTCVATTYTSKAVTVNKPCSDSQCEDVRKGKICGAAPSRDWIAYTVAAASRPPSAFPALSPGARFFVDCARGAGRTAGHRHRWFLVGLRGFRAVFVRVDPGELGAEQKCLRREIDPHQQHDQ